MSNKIIFIILGFFLANKEYIVYNYELIIIIGLIILFYFIISNITPIITEILQKQKFGIQNIIVESIIKNINQLILEKNKINEKLSFYRSQIIISNEENFSTNYLKTLIINNDLLNNFNYNYIQKLEHIPLTTFTQLISLTNYNIDYSESNLNNNNLNS